MNREELKIEILKITANTLQHAIEVIKRQDKWDAVEELSTQMWNILDELEELRYED